MDEILPGQGGKVQDQGLTLQLFLFLVLRTIKSVLSLSPKPRQGLNSFQIMLQIFLNEPVLVTKPEALMNPKKIACPSW